MFNALHAETAQALWIEAANLFSDRNQVLLQSSRSGSTLEVLNAALTLTNPRQRWIASREPAINPAFALVEVVWILLGRNDSDLVNYFNSQLPNFQGTAERYHGAYGYRLRHAFGIDQLRIAASALRANPDSRQVVLQIWGSDRDFPTAAGIPRSPDIPCNIVSLLKVRNNTLHWTQIMRSNDVFLGFPHNIVQFTSLQEILAGWIGVAVGDYNHYSDSFHVYESDLSKLDVRVSNSLPANCDDIALPEGESLNALDKLNEIIQKMVHSSISTSSILHDLTSSTLPLGFRNWLAIISAEACRRRKDLDAAENAASVCENPCLTFMWKRWKERMRRTITSTV